MSLATPTAPAPGAPAPAAPPPSVTGAPRPVRLPELQPVPLDGAAPLELADLARPKLRAESLSIHYGPKLAVRDVTLDVPSHAVTAFIGPSGCGKSSILRAFDRMNDLVPGARVSGRVTLDGEDIYGPDVQPVEVRRRVGMVFQRPNPFPMSVYENVAYGPRRHGVRGRGRLDEIVERSLRQSALWDEVKDDLRRSGLALSGGQQQRLCIARSLATEPDVILMDEPCSALDPVATAKIEELIHELERDYTIVIVTHNMQQASRVSDLTAFFTLDPSRAGYLVEMGPTREIFTNPREQLTEDYVSGRFG